MKLLQRCIAVGGVWSFWASSAVGRDDYTILAPELESSIPWKAIGLTAAGAFGLILCILKDSKRTFQQE